MRKMSFFHSWFCIFHQNEYVVLSLIILLMILIDFIIIIHYTPQVHTIFGLFFSLSFSQRHKYRVIERDTKWNKYCQRTLNFCLIKLYDERLKVEFILYKLRRCLLFTKDFFRNIIRYSIKILFRNYQCKDIRNDEHFIEVHKCIVRIQLGSRLL